MPPLGARAAVLAPACTWPARSAQGSLARVRRWGSGRRAKLRGWWLWALATSACGTASIELLPRPSEPVDVDASVAPVPPISGPVLLEQDAGGSGQPSGPALDGGVSDPGDAGACVGARVFGICFYLGDQGEGCRTTCAQRGGFDVAALAHVGTPRQGGSLEDCVRVLRALGRGGEVHRSSRDDGLGLGCHLWDDDNHWLTGPSADFDPNLELGQGWPVRIACGCRR